MGGRPLHAAVDDLRTQLVRALDPALVILFGSVAHGDDGPDSDVDLLVVLDDAPVDRRRALVVDARRATRAAGVPRDILVTSSADFDRRRRWPGTIEHESDRTGIVIHDRRHAA